MKNYHRYLKNEFNRKQFGESENLSLSDIYTTNSGFTQSKESINDIEHYLIKWVEENSRKQLAILGEYGQGKSVLSLKIALEIFHNRSNLRRTPIVIELRGKSPRNLSIHELLAVWASNYHVDPKIIRLLYETDRLVIIFDAFDEMDLIGDPEVRMQHFKSLWKFASNPKSKIIITGRPNLFLDEVSLKRALGIGEPSQTLPYCESIEINKFNKTQIKQALRNFDSDIRKEILKHCDNVEESNTFVDLISRPSTLTLVATIWHQVKGSIVSGGATPASIIKEFINHTYSRQYEKVKDNIEAKPIISVPEREYFMYGIAMSMLMISGLQNQIENERLRTTILRLLDNIPDALSSIVTMFDSRDEPLKKRLENIPHAKESVISDVLASGILVRDPSKTDSFRFAHKSFFEFLVANCTSNIYLASDNEKESIIFNSLQRDIDLSLFERKLSKEISVFTGQLLSKEFDTSLTEFKKANMLFKVLFPTSVLSLNHSMRSVCFNMFKNKITSLWGPYEGLLLIPIIGRLRVFSAYAVVELKLSDKDLKRIVGSKITALITNPKSNRIFSTKERIFHKDFNLIEGFQEKKKRQKDAEQIT